jgi:hypothetical protein
MSSVSAATKNVQLSDHKDTLLAYEQRYRSSKGDDRREIMAQIIEEIIPQGKGKLRADAFKGLETVS